MTFRIAVYESKNQEVLLGKPYSNHSLSGLLAMLLESRNQFYVQRDEYVVIEEYDEELNCWVVLDDF